MKNTATQPDKTIYFGLIRLAFHLEWINDRVLADAPREEVLDNLDAFMGNVVELMLKSRPPEPK